MPLGNLMIRLDWIREERRNHVRPTERTTTADDDKKVRLRHITAISTLVKILSFFSY